MEGGVASATVSMHGGVDGAFVPASSSWTSRCGSHPCDESSAGSGGSSASCICGDGSIKGSEWLYRKGNNVREEVDVEAPV